MEKKSLRDKFVQMRQANIDARPSLGGQIDATFRDVGKQTVDTLNKAFFGEGIGAGEPGTPLNPTSFQVTKSLGATNADAMSDGLKKSLAEQQEAAKGKEPDGNEKDKSNENERER